MTEIERLRILGCSDQHIAKAKAILDNPDAHAYAMRTGDFEGAYLMTLPKEKSEIDLNEWFSSFTTEMPEDAKSLSIALTKFSRFVQSEVDKKKASQ